MGLDSAGLHQVLGKCNASLVNLVHGLGMERQAGWGLGLVEIVEDPVKRRQRATRPGFANLTEQAMLDGRAFGSTWWIMTDGPI